MLNLCRYNQDPPAGIDGVDLFFFSQYDQKFPINEFIELRVHRLSLLVHLIVCIRRIIQHRIYKGESSIEELMVT